MTEEGWPDGQRVCVYAGRGVVFGTAAIAICPVQSSVVAWSDDNIHKL